VGTSDNTDRPRDQGKTDEYDPEHHARPGVQIVTTAISVLLIAILAGAILYEGLNDRVSNPAQIETDVRVADAAQRGAYWYVPVVITNAGDDTAEQLVVAFTVMDGQETILETDTTVDQLGESESITTTIVVDTDPAELTIEAVPETFHIAEE
jgi:uncharacterized protein (TIGR02588 family)